MSAPTKPRRPLDRLTPEEIGTIVASAGALWMSAELLRRSGSDERYQLIRRLSTQLAAIAGVVIEASGKADPIGEIDVSMHVGCREIASITIPAERGRTSGDDTVEAARRDQSLEGARDPGG